jgi:putative copper export protein
MTGLAVAALIQWLALASLVMLIGATALDLFVLPPNAPALDGARRSLRRWVGLSTAMLFMATMGHLLIRTRTMSGGGLGALMAAIPLVLTRTHFGTVWIARFAALAALTVCLIMSGRRARSAVFLLAIGLGLTTSLTGHASDWGDFSVSVLIDYGHLLAAAIWIGGLLGLALAVFPRVSRAPAPVVVSIASRFSAVAGIMLAIVVISGSYNAWVQTRVVSALWMTTYGRVLLVKICLVLAVVGFGALNRFAVLPGLAGTRPSGTVPRLLTRVGPVGPRGSSEALRVRLAGCVMAEAVLGVVILACTAVLSESTPARHAIRMHHQGTMDDAADEARTVRPHGP